MMVVTYFFLLASPPLERMLGRTGTIVITRLLGMLLAALVGPVRDRRGARAPG